MQIPRPGRYSMFYLWLEEDADDVELSRAFADHCRDAGLAALGWFGDIGFRVAHPDRDLWPEEHEALHAWLEEQEGVLHVHDEGPQPWDQGLTPTEAYASMVAWEAAREAGGYPALLGALNLESRCEVAAAWPERDLWFTHFTEEEPEPEAAAERDGEEHEEEDGYDDDEDGYDDEPDEARPERVYGPGGHPAWTDAGAARALEVEGGAGGGRRRRVILPLGPMQLPIRDPGPLGFNPEDLEGPGLDLEAMGLTEADLIGEEPIPETRLTVDAERIRELGLTLDDLLAQGRWVEITLSTHTMTDLGLTIEDFGLSVADI